MKIKVTDILSFIASNLGFTPAGNISATNTQAAIEELDSEKASNTGPGGVPLGQLLPTVGGDGVVSIYRINTTTVKAPRSFTISSISSDVITITTTAAAQIFDNTRMSGVSYLRIWNTSKSPKEAAWVKAQPSTTTITVTDAADIAGWSATETIQAGDGSGVWPLPETDVVALDISPMMQNLFGEVFYQKGIVCRANIIAWPVNGNLRLSTAGEMGGDTVAAMSSVATGLQGEGSTYIPCSVASPISNSNLVLVREDFPSGGVTAGVRLVSSFALVV